MRRQQGARVQSGRATRPWWQTESQAQPPPDAGGAAGGVGAGSGASSARISPAEGRAGSLERYAHKARGEDAADRRRGQIGRTPPQTNGREGQAGTAAVASDPRFSPSRSARPACAPPPSRTPGVPMAMHRQQRTRLVMALLALLLLRSPSTSARRGPSKQRRPLEPIDLPKPTTTREAEALVRSTLAQAESEPQGDPRRQVRVYRAVLESVRPLAGHDAMLELLDQTAKLSRRVKQHSEALQCHQEMLALRGQAGAIAESYLVLWTEMATDMHLSGKYTEALQALDQAEAQLADALSAEGLALMYKQRAVLHDCAGEYQQAAQQMTKAQELAEAPELKGRLDDVLRHRTMLQRMVAVEPPLRQGVASESAELDRAKSEAQQQIDAMGEYLVRHGPWASVLQMPHNYIPTLSAAPWHDARDAYPELTPIISVLREAAPSLRKEYRKLKRRGLLLSDEDCIQRPQGGRWMRYEISAVWQQLNGTHCSSDSPVACAVLSRLRDTNTAPILRAGYSVTEPFTWIRPHFGSSNAQLKIHLGLRVDDCARMRVGTEWRHWHADDCVLFDDSFEHEVHNACDKERVVFQVVVRHPELSWEDAQTYTPVIMDAH